MATARPAKRRRLSPGLLDTRQADPDLLGDVDGLIIDYVVCNALAAIFTENSCQDDTKVEAVGKTNVHLSLVDSFLTMDRSKHPGTAVPETTSFRLALLSFVVLFTRRQSNHGIKMKEQRITSKDDGRARTSLPAVSDPSRPTAAALAALRKKNRQRAQAWHCRAERTGDINYVGRSADSRVRRGSASGAFTNGNPAADVVLLDLIPSFISLTARRARLAGSDWTTSERWLELVANFMLHAVREQVNLGHESMDEVEWEAFAWGPIDPQGVAGDDAMAIDGTVDDRETTRGGLDNNNILFSAARPTSSSSADSHSTSTSDSGEAAAPWYRLRDAAILSVRNPYSYSGQQGSSSLNGLAELEQDIHSFMTALASSISIPLLRQLESAASDVANGSTPKIELDGDPLDGQEVMRLLKYSKV